MTIINFLQPDTGNFLVQIIAWLVKITSSVAAGVILFTVILKLITLPFDFFSRYSMRKNAVRMEKMRPELEKLQKQYAGNKDLYNQKMMALYKKNGYTMLGACLPTIITLAIFIVAINAFTTYSHYQNLCYFYDMSNSYNNVVYAGFDIDGDKIKRDEDGKLIIDDEYFLINSDSGNNQVILKDKDNNDFTVTINKTVEKQTDGKDSEGYYTLTTTNSYITYKRYWKVDSDKYEFSTREYSPIDDKITTDNKLASGENNYLKVATNKIVSDTDDETMIDFSQAKSKKEDLTASDFLSKISKAKSAETFRNNGSKFLWVKNIWVSDRANSHPIESNWDTFKKTYSYKDTNKKGETSDMSAESYAMLIEDLQKEQTEANGYYILVIITAGISFLSQFIMSKSQKSQMELQTVDGQGAMQQKMMMWIMPIMMAVFSFMYTAAFSIYVILSSCIGILTTLGINFIVDRKFKKAEEKENSEVVRSKVRVIKEEPKEEQKKKEEPEQVDFLSGLADKKGKKHK